MDNPNSGIGAFTKLISYSKKRFRKKSVLFAPWTFWAQKTFYGFIKNNESIFKTRIWTNKYYKQILLLQRFRSKRKAAITSVC